MNDYQTLDQLVQQINDSANGTTMISGGTDVRSPEQIAAAYALECVEESGDGFGPMNDFLYNHLEVLTAAGAVFDEFEAAGIAEEISIKRNSK